MCVTPLFPFSHLVFLSKILQYTCTGCSVEQHEVVAIVFEDAASAITFPCHVVKKYIYRERLKELVTPRK